MAVLAQTTCVCGYRLLLYNSKVNTTVCLTSRKHLLFAFLLLYLHGLEGMPKGFIQFKGELLISNFEEDVPV